MGHSVQFSSGPFEKSRACKSDFLVPVTDTHTKLFRTEDHEWVLCSSEEITHWNRLPVKASAFLVPRILR